MKYTYKKNKKNLNKTKTRKKNTYKLRKLRKLIGGTIKSVKTITKTKNKGLSSIKIEEYRTTFFNKLKKIQENESNDITLLNKSIEEFGNFLKSSKSYINILIPINSLNEPLPTKYTTNPVNFLPPIVIINNFLKKNYSKIQLIKLFKSLNGNFNLLSRRNNISAISNEILKKNIQMINLLISLGAIPTQKEQIEINNLESENAMSKFNFSIQTSIDTNIEYDPNKFWYPIFSQKELNYIKETIQNMIKLDGIDNLIREFNYRPDKKDPNYNKFYEEDATVRTERYNNKWRETSICSIVRDMFKNYDIQKDPTNIKNYYVKDSASDILISNVVLCILFLLLGIINSKLSMKDFYFIFKGGKAIQMELSDLSYCSQTYPSDDIDIAIVQTKLFNLEINHIFALHLVRLLYWFIIPQDFGLVLLLKDDVEKNLIKISYKKISDIQGVPQIKALCDIAYNKIDEEMQQFFRFNLLTKKYINVPNFEKIQALYIYQNNNIILNEKLYLLLKYIKQLERKENNICDSDCLFYIAKFKKSIYPLVEIILTKNGQINQDKNQWIKQYIINEFKESEEIAEKVIQHLS